jgi:PAS domain-containing protein
MSLLLSDQGEILSCSPSVQALLEYSEQDLLGYSVEVLLAGREDRFDALLRNPQADGSPVRIGLRTMSGLELPVEAHASRLFGGDTDHTLLILRKLT